MNFSLVCVEWVLIYLSMSWIKLHSSIKWLFYRRCGENIDSLYIEYSEGNIKLTRCSNCSAVADKYIEYETVLVLIDVVLHRKKAYRHILFNRHQLDGAKVLLISLMIFMCWDLSILEFDSMDDVWNHPYQYVAQVYRATWFGVPFLASHCSYFTFINIKFIGTYMFCFSSGIRVVLSSWSTNSE